MHPDHAALIPRGSPLSLGWRADLVAILAARSLVDVMDTIAQYAELRVRLEPDTARDPLDAAEPSVVERQRLFTDPQGRPYYGAPRPNKGDVPLTTARAADPAHRRIDAVTEMLRAADNDREPSRSKLRGHNSKLRTIRPIFQRHRPGRRSLDELFPEDV
jgi:hypothetical protein